MMSPMLGLPKIRDVTRQSCPEWFLCRLLKIWIWVRAQYLDYFSLFPWHKIKYCVDLSRSRENAHCFLLKIFLQLLSHVAVPSVIKVPRSGPSWKSKWTVVKAERQLATVKVGEPFPLQTSIYLQGFLLSVPACNFVILPLSAEHSSITRAFKNMYHYYRTEIRVIFGTKIQIPFLFVLLYLVFSCNVSHFWEVKKVSEQYMSHTFLVLFL